MILDLLKLVADMDCAHQWKLLLLRASEVRLHLSRLTGQPVEALP